MACMCEECKFAKETENSEVALCDNWESDYYGEEMDLNSDGCDCGEVDLVTKVLEGEE